MEETPVLFAPDFSQYTTTKQTIQHVIENNTTIEARKINAENTAIVNKAAAVIDGILKTAADAIIWEYKTNIFGFYQSYGCDFVNIDVAHEMTICMDKSDYSIRCFYNNLAPDFINKRCYDPDMREKRKRDIINMLADVFKPLSYLTTTTCGLECHIRFPEACDTSDEQA